MRFDQFGIDQYGLPQDGQRFLQLPGFTKRHAECSLRLCRTGREFGGLPQGFDGRLKFAQAQARRAQIIISGRLRRLELYCLFKSACGIGGITHRIQQHAQICMKLGIFRLQVEGALQGFDRARGVLRLLEQISEREVNANVIGL